MYILLNKLLVYVFIKKNYEILIKLSITIGSFEDMYMYACPFTATTSGLDFMEFQKYTTVYSNRNLKTDFLTG